uniref:Putative secreted protein n=1 Tax=Anopheles darlingi TaxID=43151 RepID=A0A2M4DJJ8_ANODA
MFRRLLMSVELRAFPFVLSTITERGHTHTHTHVGNEVRFLWHYLWFPGSQTSEAIRWRWTVNHSHPRHHPWRD